MPVSFSQQRFYVVVQGGGGQLMSLHVQCDMIVTIFSQPLLGHVRHVAKKKVLLGHVLLPTPST